MHDSWVSSVFLTNRSNYNYDIGTRKGFKIGIALTKKMMDDVHSGLRQTALDDIVEIFRISNLIYEMQMNLVLEVAEVYVSDGTELWDNLAVGGTGPTFDCRRYFDSGAPDINTQLNLFSDWVAALPEAAAGCDPASDTFCPTNSEIYASWHLFEDCFNVDNIPGSYTVRDRFSCSHLHVFARGVLEEHAHCNHLPPPSSMLPSLPTGLINPTTHSVLLTSQTPFFPLVIVPVAQQ